MEPKPLPQTAPRSPQEARAAAVERLCDGFSHDTRNPLNAVVIHLEVLSDKLRRENGGAIPAGLEKNLKAIRDQVGRLDEMVRRFVEIAAPHRQHEPEFDLAALAQSVVEQCTHQARLARADLRLEAAGALRVVGSASAMGVALTLAILELLDGGARRLVVRLEPASKQARISIEGGLAQEGPAVAALRQAACGGTVVLENGRIELALPRSEPELQLVAESMSQSS